ncbi:MAG TPA: hypothetical protein DD381_09250 [Lentisphaeria bacterium]|nr:MAG: hypothetical protein A2X47_13555 [Lentisphaerae bacterium GWF2_38_69]HBM16509.1 hypothetical protein [Lentisphaeria bacterium]
MEQRLGDGPSKSETARDASYLIREIIYALDGRACFLTMRLSKAPKAPGDSGHLLYADANASAL